MSEITDNMDGFTDPEEAEEFGNGPGIVAKLGQLKEGAVVAENGIAHLFDRHVTSVKRAIKRGELPPPCRLFGQNVWTVGALLRHFESRLVQAKKEAEDASRRLSKFRT